MKPIRPTENSIHFCATCDNEVGEDRWCEGCGAFICESCDNQVQDLLFDHDPEDHGGREGDSL